MLNFNIPIKTTDEEDQEVLKDHIAKKERRNKDILNEGEDTYKATDEEK